MAKIFCRMGSIKSVLNLKFSPMLRLNTVHSLNLMPHSIQICLVNAHLFLFNTQWLCLKEHSHSFLSISACKVLY